MTIVEDRPSATAFDVARRSMIDSQLRTSGVNAPAVLARMAAVPRERFVPESAKGVAYMDRSVPLADGRRLAAPVVQGMTLQEADPQLSDKALLVDGGSGYLAELLRPMVGSLEVISADEAVTASRKRGDFTLLVIDGAIEELPAALAKRLADGARVVTGIVSNRLTRLAVGRKAADEVSLMPLAELGIPVLPEFAKPKEWTF